MLLSRSFFFLCTAVLFLVPGDSRTAAQDRPPALAGYLPARIAYDPAVPTPRTILGHEVGEWHVRHDQLVRYMEILASASPRVRLEVQGATHEGRPLILVTITSAQNQGRLEDLRRAHLDRLDRPTPPAPAADAPAVLWLGYSIHGDEASGSNASLLVAYHLAAAQDPGVEKLLQETIVLIDPSLNPDGLGRFAQWANGHRGAQPAAAVDHREHQQVWPGGRTNHYWFDLNRDWLLLQHPESQARMKTFQSWRPHLSGDFHEMGSDSTYFFQPGVPQRVNPLIPTENQELTWKIAEFHARSFDRHGVAYFTEEQFDDFYPGKGSTYPDLAGTVGILFEQASARGHRRDTINGLLTFPEAVHHHFLTSLSMLEAVHELRGELQAYQLGFAAEALAMASKDPVGGWVFRFPGDRNRRDLFLRLLLRHHLEVRPLAQDLTLGNESYGAGDSFFVPSDQPRYRLAKALFEVRTEFASSTFYDVSTWNFGHAFGAHWAAVPRKATPRLGDALETAPAYQGKILGKGTYAYAIHGSSYYAHRLLDRVLEAGHPARLATTPFEAVVSGEKVRFEAGSLVFPAKPGYGGDQLKALLRQVAAEEGTDVFALATGLTLQGHDLGSSSLKPVQRPRPFLVVGDGISAYDVGSVWHLLDFRFRLEVPLVDKRRVGRMDLTPFTHMILVPGDYEDLEGEPAAALRRWIRSGGTVIATKAATDWAAEHPLAEPGEGGGEAEAGTAPKEADKAPPGAAAQGTEVPRRTYGEFVKDRQAQRVSGAIFAVEADRTHPLAFGFSRDQIAVFRNTAKVLEASSNPYENPIVFRTEPLLSGYSSKENLEKLAGSAAAVTSRKGRGAVIRLGFDPSFRGFWYGTDRFYLNSLFFSSAIRETPPPEKWHRERNSSLVD